MIANTARYYDPSEGRFLSEDQNGFRGGDVNLYRYVYNRPIEFTDPMGERGRSKKEELDDLIKKTNEKIANIEELIRRKDIPNNTPVFSKEWCLKKQDDFFGQSLEELNAQLKELRNNLESYQKEMNSIKDDPPECTGSSGEIGCQIGGSR